MNIIKNIKVIITLTVLILSLFSAGMFKAWSMDKAINENTEARLEDKYDRTWERIDRLLMRCGDKAVNCGEQAKKDYRRWVIQMENLKNKLGYQEE